MSEKYGELSKDASGTDLQIFPLLKGCQGESSGDIDTKNMRAILLLGDCDITVDGGLAIPVKSGSVWGVEGCDLITVSAPTKYAWM